MPLCERNKTHISLWCLETSRRESDAAQRTTLEALLVPPTLVLFAATRQSVVLVLDSSVYSRTAREGFVPSSLAALALGRATAAPLGNE